MYKPKNWQVCVLAAICAYFVGGIAYYLAHVISNSYEAAALVSLMSMIAAFMYIASRANGSRVDIEHPRAILIDAPRITVLAEVKDALSSKHFGDKKWSLDNLNERKGTACFSCKLIKQSEDRKPPKQHVVTLLAKSDRLTNASSLELHYEVIGETLNQYDALKLCEDTTQYIENQMHQLQAARA